MGSVDRFDHRYTQDGLTRDRLKGIDRPQADVLFEAAERAGCVAHLALVTLWQHGTAEGGYDEYSYYGSRRSRWLEDDSDDYEMGEIFDTSLSVDHWSDRGGRKVRFGKMHLDENEIVADAALDDGNPSEEDFEGFTGNDGITVLQ